MSADTQIPKLSYSELTISH